MQNYSLVIVNTILSQSRCQLAHNNDPLVIPKHIIDKVLLTINGINFHNFKIYFEIRYNQY